MIDHQKSECPAGTGQFADQTKLCAADSIAIESKTIATLIAKFALAGHAVHRLESGFLVSRWGMSKLCNDLAELRSFARKVGAL